MADSVGRTLSKPFMGDVDFAIRSKSTDDGRATRTAQELATNQARQKQVNEVLSVTPPVIAATPAPATPPPQARPIVGPPAPQMSANPAPEGRLNPLTGLPMGYRPGDSVSPQYQASADQSVTRQKSAQDAAIASAPRAVPVASPNALADQHTAAVASYKQDLDPAKAVKAAAIYSGGTDQQKAQMAANTLKRAAGVTSATRPQFAATRAMPTPQPRKSLMPGLSPPRFAMGR